MGEPMASKDIDLKALEEVLPCPEGGGSQPLSPLALPRVLEKDGQHSTLQDHIVSPTFPREHGSVTEDISSPGVS